VNTSLFGFSLLIRNNFWKVAFSYTILAQTVVGGYERIILNWPVHLRYGDFKFRVKKLFKIFGKDSILCMTHFDLYCLL
jgi:hypothetical protein